MKHLHPFRTGRECDEESARGGGLGFRCQLEETCTYNTYVVMESVFIEENMVFLFSRAPLKSTGGRLFRIYNVPDHVELTLGFIWVD